MCTVSWFHEDGGYHLLCNRDEKRTRVPAAPPAVRVRGGVRFIAPADGDFGGTWIATNEFGVSICLLNGASAGRAARSRGLLLLDLAGEQSSLEVCTHIWRADLTAFAPFTLVALEPGLPAAVAEWDGAEKAIVLNGESLLPLVSSSFEPAAVRAYRRRQFRRQMVAAEKVDAHVLYRFHESHGSRPDAYSPCMHRPDAETVSFSWVRVSESEAEFFYSPGAPCQWMPGQTTRIPLRS
jgi:hypothetical protein